MTEPRALFSLRAAAQECPDQFALLTESEAFTFAELAARSEVAIAELERKLGPLPPPSSAAPEHCVGVVATLHSSTLVALYAALEVGVPFVGIAPRMNAAERARLATRLPLSPLLLPGWEQQLPRDEPAPASVAAARSFPPHAAACVVFTSGTTGLPKAAVLSRGALEHSVLASAQNLGWCDDDRWLLCLPLQHMGGLSIALRCLAARKPVVLVTHEADASLDLRRVATAIAAQEVTLLSLVPVLLARLLDLPGFELPRAVRAILLGGDAAPAALLRRALDRGWPVFTTYGMTETASQVTTQRYALGPGQDPGCGPALPGVQLEIDGSGNVCVRGPSLFSGYWLPPTLDPQRDEQGWFHTPDLGRLDEHGCLHLLGRSSDLLISGGENVHPLEVERIIEAHPTVRRCCVFGVPDASWGQLVCALLEGPSELDDALRAHLREALMPHQRPRHVALVDALPETPAGKLDRPLARELFTPRLFPLG